MTLRERVAFLILPSILSFFLVQTQSSLERTIKTLEAEMHYGWTACRVSDVINPAYGCNLKNQRRNSPHIDNRSLLFNVSKLPTTAMAVLIDNQQINSATEGNVTMENIYYSQNMAVIPDISEVGRDYYTLIYQINISSSDVCSNNNQPYYNTFLNFAGINYRSKVWYNGNPLPNMQPRNFITISSLQAQPEYPGMFVRHRYDITMRCDNSTTDRKNLFVIMIEPPDHPGYPAVGQQGGSHDLAKDGAVPQYMLGWDWCTHMPDRATGFYGSVTLQQRQAISNGPDSPYMNRFPHYTIQDAAVQTTQLQNCSWSSPNSGPRYACYDIQLQILAHIESWSQQFQPTMCSTADEVSHTKLIIQSDWDEIWNITLNDPCSWNDNKGFYDLQSNIVVHNPDKVTLWWPHGVGVPEYAHLHIFTISLYVVDIKMDVVTVPVGIRTIETYLDSNIQGQRFRVNHHDIYLVGGNWIGTDQALRYSASRQRYCDEILLHQYAGLNLIRVWGGSTAERDQFYDCADQYGILVFQEFWMTGDNNGRWAGNYSWPFNYEAYLVNVEDTIKRLRRHASLLFYGGCNECLSSRTSEWAPNPPRTIDDGIRILIETFDPGRFYISSSMGGVCSRRPVERYVCIFIQF
jgi:mannosylglycoprotein endo-beta-mannosidase